METRAARLKQSNAYLQIVKSRDEGKVENRAAMARLKETRCKGEAYCEPNDTNMPIRTLIEVESPSPIRYLIGAVVMMIGVVLPVGYMMFRNKRVPSSSSYTKQTNKVLI
ncbi:hypothetical protein QL285_045229 [Trifolium repens]|nr:hypothetical protein QL285_045229 [Trifolium repens]